MTRIIIALVTFAAMLQPVAAREAVPPGACYSGAYAMSDESYLVIAPSDAPNLRYRTLSGASGKLYPTSDRRYESGDGWSVREPVTLHVAFGACNEGTIQLQRKQTPVMKGHKVSLPTIPINFESGDVALYGELVMPADRPPRAIVVLQYGSGRDSAVIYNFLPRGRSGRLCRRQLWVGGQHARGGSAGSRPESARARLRRRHPG